MTTKTISITEEAYERLRSKKDERESFSDVINRITNKRPLSDFLGVLNEKEADLLENTIGKNRKINRELHEKRVKYILKGLKLKRTN